MPLVTTKPGAEQPVIEASGRALPVEMATPIVETRFQPLSSLLAMVEGSIFVMDFYRELVEQDSQLIGHQGSRDPTLQQYEKISRMETKLQGSFGYSQDEQKADQSITGETLVYPPVVPNTGNMFTADVGDGRKGLFKVTSCVKNTWRKQTLHRIQFQMTDIQGSPTWDQQMRQLEEKVEFESIFVKDFMLNNKNPVVMVKTYEEYRNIRRTYQTMLLNYFRTFYSEDKQTLLIPDQRETSYDPFLTRAVLALAANTDSPYVKKLSEHDVEVEPAYRTTTVWDSLLMVEPSHLHVACQRMCLRTTQATYNRPALGGLYWTGISYATYPIDKRTDADIFLIPSSTEEGERLIKSRAPVDDLNRLILNKDLTDVEIVDEEPAEELPRRSSNIHRVTNDEYYVFSKAFYEREEPNMSRLERLVWSVLDHDDINPGDVLELMTESKQWDNLDRFYYVPVLMVLCTIVMRGPNINGA